MSKSILVVAPHADDETLGCGGAIARHVAEGDVVRVLVLTNANKGAPEIFSVQAVQEIRDEAARAHRILGVTETCFEEFPAPRLDTEAGYKISAAISRHIRQSSAEVLYIPFRGDLHVDHRVIFTAALVAARPINDCPVKRILAYETLSETDWAAPFADDAFIPTTFVDISGFLQRKLDALACFMSQMKPFPNSRSLEAVTALARLRGATVSVQAAEAFHLIREIR